MPRKICSGGNFGPSGIAVTVQPVLRIVDFISECASSIRAKGADITEDAILYLEKKTYRTDCRQNRKRAIRKKCQKLRLVNGEILKRGQDKLV